MFSMAVDSVLIAKTARYVKLKTYYEPAGHDWFHIERVWIMAKYLQAKEGGDLALIEMAALLHNVGDHFHHEFNEEKGTLALFGMMDILEIGEPLKEKIIAIVNYCKYKGDETKPAGTLEAKIVQDANWLDSLGAIGVARSFAAGGYLGRIMYDPAVMVRTNLSKAVYQKKKREGTTINSFYEKALKLPALMNTPTARQMAEHKVRQIRNFIAQFMKEWEGKDIEETLSNHLLHSVSR